MWGLKYPYLYQVYSHTLPYAYLQYSLLFISFKHMLNPFSTTKFPHFYSLFMASLICLLLILIIPSSSAQSPPSPGYNPSSQISSVGFDKGYRNLWGPQHQRVEQGSLTIWLDSTSGPAILSYFFVMQPSILL